MNPNDLHYTRPLSRLTVRRFALLASVAAVAGGLLLAGPGGFDRMTGFASPAQAAEAVHAQNPAGFADLVAKVKPAVISVRVKITARTRPPARARATSSRRSAARRWTSSSSSSASANMPNGARPRQVITGEGSGFFISADGYVVTNNHVVDHAELGAGHDRRRHELHRQGDRHRSEDRPRADQGRRQGRLPLRAVRRPGAARRRLGGRGRQSVRPRRHGHGRHRLGARAATSARARTTTTSRSTRRSTGATPAARRSTSTAA